jgi:uncharacterized protein YggT (Ycf19 family)
MPVEPSRPTKSCLLSNEFEGRGLVSRPLLMHCNFILFHAVHRFMSVTDSFFSHWYFHVPNLIMAALIYTLIGRYLLELMFAKNPNAVIVNVFRQITEPVVNLVRAITPAIVPNGLVVVFAIVWLMALRMFLYLTIIASGVKPFLGAGS